MPMNADANTDRFLLALGGFLGFGGAFLAAINMGGDDISSALLRASIGMLVGAGMMKLLIMVAHSLFRDAKIEQLKQNIQKASKPDDASGKSSAKA